MNLSMILGLLAALGLLSYIVINSFGDPESFLEVQSLIIVFGGTIAATLISFPVPQIYSLLRIFLSRMFGFRKRDYIKVVQDLGVLSKAYRKGRKTFEDAARSVSHPFIADGAQLLAWEDSEISPEELRDLLETRAKTHFNEYMKQADFFKTISKFPPAFGLLGTTVGMIVLLKNLGAGGVETLGPAMAVALMTTFYGLIVANLLLIPIAENLVLETEDDFLLRKMVVEGLMLIQQGKPTAYVEEKLRSFLLPSQRLKEKS